MKRISEKIIDAEMMRAFIESRPDIVFVFTNGCFDLLHVGHLATLYQASCEGDCLIVGLNSDASVRSIKGDKRPIIAQNERASVLAALECVDYVVLFDETTPCELIDYLKPDLFVKGGDYEGADIPERSVVEKNGGSIRFLPYIEQCSTTGIIDTIRERFCN